MRVVETNRLKILKYPLLIFFTGTFLLGGYAVFYFQMKDFSKYDIALTTYLGISNSLILIFSFKKIDFNESYLQIGYLNGLIKSKINYDHIYLFDRDSTEIVSIYKSSQPLLTIYRNEVNNFDEIKSFTQHKILRDINHTNRNIFDWLTLWKLLGLVIVALDYC